MGVVEWYGVGGAVGLVMDQVVGVYRVHGPTMRDGERRPTTDGEALCDRAVPESSCRTESRPHHDDRRIVDTTRTHEGATTAPAVDVERKRLGREALARRPREPALSPIQRRSAGHGVSSPPSTWHTVSRTRAENSVSEIS